MSALCQKRTLAKQKDRLAAVCPKFYWLFDQTAKGLLGWQIGHWRSRYRVFDHRGGRRGLRLDPDIIGEAKPTAVRSAADLSAPKRGMCRRPAIRSAVNHL